MSSSIWQMDTFNRYLVVFKNGLPFNVERPTLLTPISRRFFDENREIFLGLFCQVTFIGNLKKSIFQKHFFDFLDRANVLNIELGLKGS